MPKPKSTAAKRAMAQRGTYATNANSVYGKPYTAGVTAAVAPFNATLKRAQQTWGQRLLECVPPAYAVRYRELVENLDEAMKADDANAAGEYAGQLYRALPIMHKAAVDAGHAPSSRDIVTTVVDGTVYAFVVRGDLGLVRKQNPDWLVFALSDAALAIRGRLEDFMQEAAKHFPNVKISEGSREIVGFFGLPFREPGTLHTRHFRNAESTVLRENATMAKKQNSSQQQPGGRWPIKAALKSAAVCSLPSSLQRQCLTLLPSIGSPLRAILDLKDKSACAYPHWAPHLRTRCREVM